MSKSKKKKSEINDNEYENQMNQYKVYFEERKMARDGLNSQRNALDTNLLFLSGGIFSLTLIFFNNYLAKQPYSLFWLLIISWFFLLCTILSTLISFLVSIKMYKYSIELLDKYYRIDADMPKNCYEGFVKVFNYISIITFLIGITFLLSFVVANYFQ